MADKLAYKPEEVADAIGYSRAKTYQMIAAGEIPSITISGQCRVTVAALKKWVGQQQKRAPRRKAAGR